MTLNEKHGGKVRWARRKKIMFLNHKYVVSNISVGGGENRRFSCPLPFISPLFSVFKFATLLFYFLSSTFLLAHYQYLHT